MSVVVVATDVGQREVAAAFLPPTPWCASGAGRLYFGYRAESGADYSFSDIDGATLIEVRVFADVTGAKAWIERDVRERAMLQTATGRAQ